MTTRPSTTTLWRPTGPKELDLVRELEWRAWPPRLPEQPIFYPVLNEDYAIKIARDWNVKHGGAGFVTRFEVESDFFPLCQTGVTHEDRETLSDMSRARTGSSSHDVEYHRPG